MEKYKWIPYRRFVLMLTMQDGGRNQKVYLGRLPAEKKR